MGLINRSNHMSMNFGNSTAKMFLPYLVSNVLAWVVVKPPEMTPLSNAWFAYAAEAVGLPEGAVNLVCGYGHEAGAALSAHPDINQVVFTGSVATGIAIASAAAKNVVPCVLELGGQRGHRGLPCF